MLKRTTERASVITTLCLALLMLSAGAALSDGAQVTSGEFQVFAAGIGNADYGDIGGRAQMVRTADGRTIVTTHVTGLLGDTAYGSHVHAAPCNVGAANGHYKHDPSGPPTPPNEIWPAFTTNPSGTGNGKDTADWIAGPTAVSVVVHAPGGAKIACADLS